MRLLALFAVAACGMLGSSCAVYLPTTPNTPILEKGQVEMTTSLRSFTLAEVTAAWSPAPHLLVTGDAATLLGTSETTINNQTYTDSDLQGSVGLGLYRGPTASSTAYFAVLGGVGWARRYLYALEDYSLLVILPFLTRGGVYDAHYRRYYGQVYVASPLARRGQCGAVLRASWLDYTSLTYDDQPIEPTNRLFMEPAFFARFGQGPLRYFFTGGASVALSGDSQSPFNARTAPSSLTLTAGLVFRPDLLKKKQ